MRVLDSLENQKDAERCKVLLKITGFILPSKVFLKSGGMEILQRLQQHENYQVGKLAFDIIENFFSDE